MIIEDDSGYAKALNKILRELLEMPEEGRKLYMIFNQKYHSDYLGLEFSEWAGYLGSLGLQLEETDEPVFVKSDGALCIPDSFQYKPPETKYITVPKDLAVKILALGDLP